MEGTAACARKFQEKLNVMNLNEGMANRTKVTEKDQNSKETRG